MQLSVPVRNAILDAYETAIGASPKLRFHTGTMPANCAAARTGTLLQDMALPADWMAAAASGQKAISGSWQATIAASGLVGYYSIVDTAGTTCHEQGLLSQPWAGSMNALLNMQVHNGSNVYRCTTAGIAAASGGPTGTGTGITDGAAVWSYVGPIDMTVDNGNVANGQSVTVTSKTLTAPGA